MALPTPVTPLPVAPSRADGPVIFNQRADPFIAALPPMVVQFNLNITWVGQQVTLIDGYRTAAAQSATDAAAAADRAEAVDTNVSEQVLAAQTAANNAQAAAAAAGAAAGLPAMVGHAGHALVVNDDEQTVSFVNLAPKRWAAVLSM